MALITPEFLWNKKYSAKRDRLALAHGGAIQAGVWDAGDFKPTWTSAMNISIAAGYALVAATNAGNLGLYHIQNDAAVTVTIPPAHASLPRLDQIYVLIDDAIDGAASDDIPTFGVAQGVAVSGATLDNRSGGANTLPNNSLRIADVLVPAAASALSAAAVRDRRQWARGAYRRIVRSSGTNYTISAGGGSPVEIDSTNLKPRIECSGAPLRVTLRAELVSNTTNARFILLPLLDGGSPEGGTLSDPFIYTTSGTVNFPNFLQPSWEILPSAGSRQLSFGWNLITAQTLTLKNDSTTQTPLLLTVEEILRPSAENS